MLVDYNHIKKVFSEIKNSQEGYFKMRVQNFNQGGRNKISRTREISVLYGLILDSAELILLERPFVHIISYSPGVRTKTEKLSREISARYSLLSVISKTKPRIYSPDGRITNGNTLIAEDLELRLDIPDAHTTGEFFIIAEKYEPPNFLEIRKIASEL